MSLHVLASLIVVVYATEDCSAYWNSNISYDGLSTEHSSLRASFPNKDRTLFLLNRSKPALSKLLHTPNGFNAKQGFLFNPALIRQSCSDFGRTKINFGFLAQKAAVNPLW